MILIFILVYLGGLLTIFAPCVLPVIPFIFAKSDQPFRRTGLPILLGMAGTFTALACIAAVGGAWLVQVNQYGRYMAMALLLMFGLALIFPSISERLMGPLVSLGGRLQERADQQGSIKGSLLLGVAVGFLWAPCAGPILGLVLAGTALNGVNFYSALLLLIFAAGAATSLGVALLAGSKMLAVLKKGFGAEEWLRKIIGVAVIVGVATIALGWDTRFLSQLAYFNTTKTEQALISKFNSKQIESSSTRNQMPSLMGATEWINSPPLTNEQLHGKVVLIDFWTYSCINCIRTLPYLKAWDAKYRDKGLVIIGVHSPEFAFEKIPSNVKQAVSQFELKYPIALDSNYSIWNAFRNQYWPAHYLVDAKGVVRDTHFGEGAYEETEKMIQDLLREANPNLPAFDEKSAAVLGSGVTAPAADIPTSPETYIGYAREEEFASPEAISKDRPKEYSSPNKLTLNHWSLSGTWRIGPESALLINVNGTINYRFEGRDLHLVMGSKNNRPIRFRVTLDGRAPLGNHGFDVDEQGYGVIKDQRLYQLIRQHQINESHLFKIEFLDTDAEVFAFTFG